jgi:predicted SnoaL-like aldol condensation-catalyzing enzyme
MSRTTESQNKVLVLEAFETLFNKRDYVAAERYWSPDYIQHSAHIEPGRDGLFNLIKSVPAALKYEPGVVVAEGDFVIVHGRFSGNGRPKNWIAADILRVINGVLVEHWDVLQDEASEKESKSGLPMFGGSFPEQYQEHSEPSVARSVGELVSTKDLHRTPPGQDWITIVQKNGTAEFGTAFAPSPVLEASVLNGPCVGLDAIAAFFAATSGAMYDSLAFTTETVDGNKTYLEWEGKAFGKDVGGTTILTRDNAGRIERIRLYHRPLHVLVQFSAELATRLKGKVDPSLFRLPNQDQAR